MKFQIMKNEFKRILVSICILSLLIPYNYVNATEVVKESASISDLIPKVGTYIVDVATDSRIYFHDGIPYVKGEEKGKFSLSGYCACDKCGSGTGITYSGAHVRENHTIAADLKVLPIGTIIILEDAVGKDGQVYDGVYVVEDKGGGVKNKHLDIYRPTHELASLVTHYGRAYGNVYIAEPIVATLSDISK